jgi:DNA-binding NtrC family response regulator
MNKKYSGHILVVDDNKSVLEATALFLELSGFTVTTCSDSTKALDMLGELEPDLLITDVCMPEVTGTQLATTMRRFAVDIPVIIMTGYAEVDMVIEAIRQNVFDVIKKPYSPEYLAATAGRAISHFRQQQLLHSQAALASSVAASDQFLQEISGIATEVVKGLEQLQPGDQSNLDTLRLTMVRSQANSLLQAIRTRMSGN